MNAHQLSSDFVTELDCFLDCAKANRLSRNLRFMLLAYLKRHKNGFPLFHDDLLNDLELLFYFLDEASHEQRKRKRAQKNTTAPPTLKENSFTETG